jgi:hypothetical protein
MEFMEYKSDGTAPHFRDPRASMLLPDESIVSMLRGCSIWREEELKAK